MCESDRKGLTGLGSEFFGLQHLRARSARRGRVHHNLHPGLDDPVQRMCVAMEPGSYCRPHRHPAGGRWELFIALQGKAAVLIFDGAGRVRDRAEISPAGATVLVEIPAGAWHTLAALQPGTVLFESKPGPYAAATDKEFASWAPGEDSPLAARFDEWFRTAGVGDTPPDQAGGHG